MHTKQDVNPLQLASAHACAGTESYTAALAPSFATLWQHPSTVIVTTTTNTNESLKQARSCEMLKHEDMAKKLLTSLGLR